MKQNPVFSFVVSAYNEEANVKSLYDRILQLTEKYNESWELIFVNDGSIDKTLLILSELAENDKRVKYIELSRNFGHQAALSAGLKQK